MKGGSAASSAVADLVKPETYEQLNAQFDNLVGGKGKRKTTKKASTDKKKESKATKTKTATTGKDKKHSHNGGVCMICGGSLMKHMNDFDDKDLQSVYNKKGGANPLFNIKYDITTAFNEPAYGENTSRALDATTLKQMSYENPSSLTPYSKFVQYGNVSGSPTMKFDYTGGKSNKKSSTTSTSTKDKKKVKKTTKA